MWINETYLPGYKWKGSNTNADINTTLRIQSWKSFSVKRETKLKIFFFISAASLLMDIVLTDVALDTPLLEHVFIH